MAVVYKCELLLSKKTQGLCLFHCRGSVGDRRAPSDLDRSRARPPAMPSSGGGGGSGHKGAESGRGGVADSRNEWKSERANLASAHGSRGE